MAPPPQHIRQPLDAWACDGKRGLLPGASKGYSLIRTVGKGEFGKALLVQDKTGNQRVMKTVDISKLDNKHRRDAVQEVTVLSSLKHPYIVRYRESFIDGGTLAIVMDFAEGGDLYRTIDLARAQNLPFGETQIVRWITQAALALTYLHGRSVMHRDVKSQNLFLTKHQNVRVGDFGISKVLRENGQLRDKERKGTPYYLSPEVIKEALYSFASDVWALGCVLYEMAALRVPFEAQSLPQLAHKIQRGPAPLLPASFSKELRRLDADMLCYDHQKRPSAPELLRRPIIQTEMKRMLSEGEERASISSTLPPSGMETPASDAWHADCRTDASEAPYEDSACLRGALGVGSALRAAQMRRVGSAPSISQAAGSCRTPATCHSRGALARGGKRSSQMLSPKRSNCSPKRSLQPNGSAHRRNSSFNSRCGDRVLMLGKVGCAPVGCDGSSVPTVSGAADETDAAATARSDGGASVGGAAPADQSKAPSAAGGGLPGAVVQDTTVLPGSAGRSADPVQPPPQRSNRDALRSCVELRRGAGMRPTSAPSLSQGRSASAGALLRQHRPTSSGAAMPRPTSCGTQAVAAAGRPSRAGSAGRNRGFAMLSVSGGPLARVC